MMIQKKNVRNVCSLYASEWHLAVMLLPYISKQVEKGVKFKTIFKNDIKEKIDDLLLKLNLNEEMKDKILSINWGENNIESKKQIEEFMKKNILNSNNISIILTGNSSEVQNNNRMINKWITKNRKIIEEKDIQICIISCFRAVEDKENIKLFINEYDYILNSSGEHIIKDVYNMYKKVISC